MKTLADLTTPAEIERKPLLEAAVQANCVGWMRGRGYWARKFSSISQRSVPDYLFGRMFTGGERFNHKDVGREIKFATEFKREGAPRKYLEKYNVTVMSTEAQYEEQEAMRAAGWIVFECDNFEDFQAKVWALEQDALED